MKRVIGYGILFILFAGLYASLVPQFGYGEVTKAFLFAIAIIALIILAAYLIVNN